MMLLGYFLYLTVAVLFCRKLATSGGTRSRAKNVLCTALGVVLVLLPHWDVVLGIPTMRKLCAEEGGLQVREEVQFPLSSVMVVSPGWPRSLCRSCFDLLVSGVALETFAEVTATGSGTRYQLIDESGTARYWLSTLGDPACSAFEKIWDTEAERRTRWKSAGAEYDGKSCIASERVLTAEAEFTLTYPSPTQIERGVATIESRRIALTRSGATRPLATLTRFQQVPWNKKYTYWGIPPAPSCPTFVRPFRPTNFWPEHLVWILSGQLQYGDLIKSARMQPRT